MKFYRYLQSIRTDNPLKKMDVVYLYLLGGFVGTIYENIYYYVYLGVYENHSGSVILPVNVVYGLGIVLMTVFLYNIKKWRYVFVFGALLGGFTEYTMSYLSEKVLGISTWNYDHIDWNINGRTTVPYMIFWGFGCLLLIVFVIPYFIKLIHKIPNTLYLVLGAFFIGVIIMDWVISFYAVTRYVQRYHDVYYDSNFVKWFDNLYHDAFMKERYPNLTFM